MPVSFIPNAQNRNRTSDTRIFSPLLYQLSYLGLQRISLRHNFIYLTWKTEKCQDIMTILIVNIILFRPSKQVIATAAYNTAAAALPLYYS